MKKERKESINILIIFQYVLLIISILFVLRALIGVAKYGVLACLASPELRANLLAATFILLCVGGFILYANEKIREHQVFDYGRYLDAFEEMDARRLEMESFQDSKSSASESKKKGEKRSCDRNAPFK